MKIDFEHTKYIRLSSAGGNVGCGSPVLQRIQRCLERRGGSVLVGLHTSRGFGGRRQSFVSTWFPDRLRGHREPSRRSTAIGENTRLTTVRANPMVVTLSPSALNRTSKCRVVRGSDNG